jgi:MFS family permease
MTTDSSEPNPQTVGRLAAFRYRDFRLFWLSLFVSNVGTWMQMTATNWLLYQLTDSPFQLGLNGIFRAVPAIFLGLISGTFADRYDRKRLLLWTQLALALLSLGLAILDDSGEHSGLADLCFHIHQRSRRFFRWSSAPSAVPISSAPLGLAQCHRAEFPVVERRRAPRAFAGRHRH